ncbi:hypothetical protein TorRG33x02_344860 [Trema orientale]|uniref:Uncharacterized protein n=1 Tax=Trema orientale TaxID=63057 RepID=A0A2P5APS4_TREOI|nr:hypothetical protein TorRG33x02_344860 [Trema orientale]
MIGNSKYLSITHTGSTCLHFNYHDHALKLLNVLRVPQNKRSLISISKLTAKNDVYVEFHSDFCVVKDNTIGSVLL